MHNIIQPDWLDQNHYPFASQTFQTRAGRLHYVDEGAGPVILFVHGNPDWSFAYRHLIAKLRTRARCVAIDHLGFGLSEKPFDWDYLPQSHADNLKALIDHLGLTDITLVCNDWGGPISLRVAVDNPDRFARIVPMNTVMWGVAEKGDVTAKLFSAALGGSVGRFLIRKRHIFVNRVMRGLITNPDEKTPDIMAHYLAPGAEPLHRKGSWVFPKQIVVSSDWANETWERRDRLDSCDVRVIWGMRDKVFSQADLHRWITAFPEAEVHEFNNAGHYPHKDAAQDVAELLSGWI